MQWQLRRRLLNPLHTTYPGSPWWRTANERLLRDGYEARAITTGFDDAGTTPSVAASVEFVLRPTARTWYRTHNISINHRLPGERGPRRSREPCQRFFLNVVLSRVLYVHALVAAPRLALGRLAPDGAVLGDPRLGTTGIFMSLSRILPTRQQGPGLRMVTDRHRPVGRPVIPSTGCRSTPGVVSVSGHGRAAAQLDMLHRLQALLSEPHRTDRT